ncbi:hypothetical protein [Sutcliffiella rhizosphaerae]|uniref:Uncharacterized protein n=1 Tax=Sutcliffiella rhizosphaerae TaxID=2880967 RepID=A0ABN8AFM8_9BACI|nr:hypothetical protein [Sutcliffiella rhizosphaerae]CAG9623156.1 hypothetical protein BACCIP111883_03952 [Sutcliffiella rhizosphaerae]
MIFGIGYRERSKDGVHQFIIQNHISKEEYDTHLTRLAEAGKISEMEDVYNLVKRNKEEYLSFTSQIEKHLDNEQLGLEANRLLINFLSSLQMFIDYGERHNKKHFGKEKMKEFQKKTNDFYDNHISYRFMVLLRNYALHYGFPLTNIIERVSQPTRILATKEDLLKFKGWKHVKVDIEKMPDLISIDVHVEVTMMFIQHLYESYIYDIAPIVLKGVEHVNSMIKDNGGHVPILTQYKNTDEFKKGNVSLDIIEPDTYKAALQIIKDHPSINIIIK